jgi:hypothetical protein
MHAPCQPRRSASRDPKITCSVPFCEAGHTEGVDKDLSKQIRHKWRG